MVDPEWGRKEDSEVLTRAEYTLRFPSEDHREKWTNYALYIEKS